MADTFTKITGLEQLDDALSYLRERSGKRLGKAAMRRYASVTARGIRRFIPKQLKPPDSQAGIGSRLIRGTAIAAKAGIGVGKAGKRAFKIVNRGSLAMGAFNVNKKFGRFIRHQRKGMGIDVTNLHWFAAGTKDRFTGQRSWRVKRGWRTKLNGNPRHFLGRIDKNKFGGFVQRGVQASRAEALAEAVKSVNRNLDAEVKAARIGGVPAHAELGIDD